MSALEAFELDVFAVVACRGCGCTDSAACWPTCWWVEPDLCSACAPTAATAPRHDESPVAAGLVVLAVDSSRKEPDERISD